MYWHEIISDVLLLPAASIFAAGAAAGLLISLLFWLWDDGGKKR